MRITNHSGLPEVFLRATLNDNYNPGPSDMTVTQLIKPPRIVELERRYKDELEVDVADRLWMLFGKAVHKILEEGDGEAVTEERLYIERQGWIISGAFDRLMVHEGLLQDYKVTTTYAIKDGRRDEWEAQLNLLAHLVREHGVAVTRLEVVAILRDWSKAGVERNHGYPKIAVQVLPLPVWSPERCEGYIDERIRLHQAARVRLPECTPAERWATADQWAVKKVGRERAVRVLDSEAEAMKLASDLGEGHSVERRGGRNVRCEGYCSVSLNCGETD